MKSHLGEAAAELAKERCEAEGARDPVSKAVIHAKTVSEAVGIAVAAPIVVPAIILIEGVCAAAKKLFG